MFSGDFQKKLRKCNSKLRIYCGDDNRKPAGIYLVSDPEANICGIDKSFIPEWPIFEAATGRMLKGGWRRALRVLISQKIIDRRWTERVFGTQIIGTRKPATLNIPQDRIQHEIEASYMRNLSKSGKPVLMKDELMDLAREVNKNASK